jgi:hypothetical protein
MCRDSVNTVMKVVVLGKSHNQSSHYKFLKGDHRAVIAQSV